VLFNPDRQGTPTAIALAAAVLVLPYSLVGPFAGVLLDRWSRRSVTVWTNALRAALALPIAAMVFLGSEGGLFFATTLVVIGLGRLLLSGLSAATPHVVAAVLGGNILDVLTLVAGDIAYRQGSIYHTAGDQELLATTTSLFMTATLLGGLLIRQTCGWGRLGFEGVLLLASAVTTNVHGVG
jgi:MFS family permease